MSGRFCEVKNNSEFRQIKFDKEIINMKEMNRENLETAQSLIIRDFELENREETLSEEDLLRLLADQIAYMIDHKLEFLLSLMYRLDIDESKVNRALSPLSEVPANIELARLVLERQKQRVFTKQHYKQDNLDGWEWTEE